MLSLVIIKLYYNHIHPSYYYIVIMLNLVIIIIIINLRDLYNICTLVQTAGTKKFPRNKKKCIKIAKELELFFILTSKSCMLK